MSDSRKAFELYVLNKIERSDPGWRTSLLKRSSAEHDRYYQSWVDSAWETWQAARAQGDEEYPNCDTCGASMDYMPWHYASKTKRHLHSCDECWPKVSPASQQVPEPDMFWDADDAEQFGGSDAQEFADTVSCDMPVGQSMVVRVQCAVQLPNRWMKITAPDETTTQWEWVQPPQEGE